METWRWGEVKCYCECWRIRSFFCRRLLVLCLRFMMRRWSDICLRMAQRNLHVWGSRRNLAPIDFHEGRDLVSFLRLISSWSSMSVQGRKGAEPWPRAESAGWRIRMVGFGVGSIGVEVPGGGVVWVFVGKVVVVAGCIFVWVIRVEAIRRNFCNDVKRRRTRSRFGSRESRSLFFLRLWIINRIGSLFWPNRDRCCGSSGRTREIRYWPAPLVGFKNRRWGMAHNWGRVASGGFDIAVSLVFSWVMCDRKRTKIWFGIQDHAGRNASMRYHCRWCRRDRQGDECVKISWSWVRAPRPGIMFIGWVFPFNWWFKEGKESR